MKKFAIILLVLILLGIALLVRLFTQDTKLDQTVFLQTTESIRNLQALDKRLSLLLTESRVNTNFEHSELLELNYQISEEFDNLRYDALFEEIESSQPLSEAVAAFETRFAARDETLETYAETNQTLTENLSETLQLTSTLLNDDRIREQSQFIDAITQNQTALLALMLSGEIGELPIQTLTETVPTQEVGSELTRYNTKLSTLKELDSPTLELFKTLNALEMSTLLDTIEDRYVEYHNRGIAGSTDFRNALIAYGIALLLALIFFAYQIRKNYRSLEQQVIERTAEIKTAYEELTESREQLIQSEKMASLGQMIAGVAHEINTPLGYVSSNVQTVQANIVDLQSIASHLEDVQAAVAKPQRDNREITGKLKSLLRIFQSTDGPELISESQQLLTDGAYGLEQISLLVRSLKDFARLDRKTTEQVDIHECIENSVTIASNPIRENNVQVTRDYHDLKTISCFPSKLNQVFLNVITNACQAMPDGGELVINSRQHDDEISIEFRDQGVGMDQATKEKMFEPFFTSKEIGEGTGLGLSIAYKIIQAHHGRIEVDSAPGSGTSLRIYLPMKRN